MRERRKRRRRNGFRQKTKVNFTFFLVIISIAVLLGYGSARFIIYPLLGGDGINLGSFGFLSGIFDSSGEKASGQDEDLKQESGNGGTAVSPQETQNSTDTKDNKDIIEDGLDIAAQSESSQTSGGYCIQFGSFSARESAEEMISDLETSGIKAEIVEKDGMFKVVSTLFENREKAVEALGFLKDTQYADAFITMK